MTFSDKKVVDAVNAHFVPVWESVAPVSVAVFDLGDGRTVRGAYGGNIALYVCNADGRVLDILPALQTPTVTLRWLSEGSALVDSICNLSAVEVERVVTSYHARRRTDPTMSADRATEVLTRATGKSLVTSSQPPREPIRDMVRKSAGMVTRPTEKRDVGALRGMAEKSKTVVMENLAPKSSTSVERPDSRIERRLLVVVAGGLGKYSAQIDEFLSRGPLKTPDACKGYVFETVLGEKLSGRTDVFVTDEPVSIAIPDED